MNAEFKASGTKANPVAEVRGNHIDELKELSNVDQLIALINESIHSMYVDRDAQLKALNSQARGRPSSQVPPTRTELF